MDMFELSDRLGQLKEKEAQLKKELSAVNVLIKDTTKLLTEQMVNQEIQNFNRNGKVFYLVTNRYVNDVATRREELYQVLRKQGFGDLIKATIHPQTLKAFVKEQIEENDEELPGWLDGLVRVYEEEAVRVKNSN